MSKPAQPNQEIVKSNCIVILFVFLCRALYYMQQRQGLYIRSPFVNAQSSLHRVILSLRFLLSCPLMKYSGLLCLPEEGYKVYGPFLFLTLILCESVIFNYTNLYCQLSFFGPCEVVVALLSSLLKEWFFLTYSLFFARYILLYAIWIRLVNEWRKWVMQYHIDIWMMDYQNGKWMMDWVGLPQSSSAAITNLPPPPSSKVASA